MCHSVRCWPRLTDTEAEAPDKLGQLDSFCGTQNKGTEGWRTMGPCLLMEGSKAGHRHLIAEVHGTVLFSSWVVLFVGLVWFGYI